VSDIDKAAPEGQGAQSKMLLGIVSDVMDISQTQNGKRKVRIIWTLSVNDSDGKPYRLGTQCVATMNKESRLYRVVKDILGVTPPVPFDTDLLIGRVNQLFVVKATGPDGKQYINVERILPVPVQQLLESLSVQADLDHYRKKAKELQGKLDQIRQIL
jgi:hypothetical protein